MKIHAIDGTLGAEVSDFDLSTVPQPGDIAALRAALEQHHLLVFTAQALTPAEHIAFSRHFGRLYVSTRSQSADWPELVIFGNASPEAAAFAPPQGGDADLEWHADHSYFRQIAKHGLLYGREVPPEGGDTLFCNTTAAYADLPEATKLRLAGLRAIHSQAQLMEFQRTTDPTMPPIPAAQLAEMPEAAHHIAHVHSDTGRTSLLLGSKNIRHIDGMTRADSQALLEELESFATSDRYLYRHRWRQGQLLMWDNQAVAHAATFYDRSRHARLMQRTTILIEDSAA